MHEKAGSPGRKHISENVTVSENRALRGTVDVLIDQLVKNSRTALDILDFQLRGLKKAPKVKSPGHLVKITNRGHVHWARVLKAEETKEGKRKRIYLSASDKKLLELLAFKTFCQSSIAVKEEQAAAIRSFLHKMDNISGRDLRIVGDGDIRSLLNQETPLREELEKWKHAEYVHNPQHPEALKVRAADGSMVRSKSEAVIVSELLRANIPFRYECPHQIQNAVVYPDFTIRHPVSGEEFIWEHFGLMDDRNYAANACRKLETYIRAGYIPMINLILTSETKDHPLDYGIVRMLIAYYFSISM